MEERMDLKIVSGVSVTKGHQEGRVVIDFGSNSIVVGSSDLAPGDLQKEVTIAPREPVDLRRSYFDQTPCHSVGLREISVSRTIQDNTIGPTTLILIEDEFQINSAADSQRLTITWKGKDKARITEITYMAIGPVSPPPPGPY
jgi:hypothetical protein